MSADLLSALQSALPTLGSVIGPGTTVTWSSLRCTVIPTCSSMPAVIPTSPTSGALLIMLGPSPSIAATMCLLTAFLAPRTVTSPRNGPDGSIRQTASALCAACLTVSDGIRRTADIQTSIPVS